MTIIRLIPRHINHPCPHCRGSSLFLELTLEGYQIYCILCAYTLDLQVINVTIKVRGKLREGHRNANRSSQTLRRK